MTTPSVEWASRRERPTFDPFSADFFEDPYETYRALRFTTAPSTFHGVTIPAGAATLLLTGAASRDERAHPDPDRFDIDRKQQIPLGFGYGIHSCLGAALARLESRVAFEEVRARYPRLRVDERCLRRVHMSNVAGFSHVPVAIDA